jgi:broad specificity phosphatase PhoE
MLQDENIGVLISSPYMRAIQTIEGLAALQGMDIVDERFDYTFWKQLDMPDIYKLSFNEETLTGVQRMWDRSSSFPAVLLPICL